MAKNYLRNNIKLISFSISAFLLVHMMKIVNYFPNWDSVYGIKTLWIHGRESGRWFSGLAVIILSSAYDLPWVRGVISAIFVSLTISLLINMFRIRNKIYQVIAIILFVAFPSMASTLTYFWNPAYMLSLFLAVLGVYFCVIFSGKKSICATVLCFTFSLGIYQIYYLISMIVFLIYIGNELLDCRNKFHEIRRLFARFLPAFICGGVLYGGVNKLLMTIFNYRLGSYQGISDIGIMSLPEYILAIQKMIKRVLVFFVEKNVITIYGMLNSCIIIAVFSFLLCILLNKKYRILRRIMICILFLSAIPVTYSFYLLSRDVYYHSVMELGNYFLYFIIFLFLEKYDIKDYLKKTVVVLLGVLCFYHFVNDNIAYHQMSFSYEKTKFSVMETIIQIDQLQKDDMNKVAVIGGFPPDKYSIIACPSIMGASSHNFVFSQEHFIQIAKYYYGREYYGCSIEEIEEIKKSKEVESMSAYPVGNYVKIVDGIIVVKLSE